MTQVMRYNQLMQLPTRPKKQHLLEPTKKKPKKITLSEAARIGGILYLAPSGWGKSRLLAKNIFSDCVHRLPQIILDVSGQSIEGFFNEVSQMRPAAIEPLLRSVVYVNPASIGGYVPSVPMLSPQRPNEPLAKTAARIPELLIQLDEHLGNAPIMGATRLIPIASSVCTILAALNLPLAHAHDLLLHPELWVERINEAAKKHSQAKWAVENLYEYMALPVKEREVRSEQFRNRLHLLRNVLDRAILSSTRPPLVDIEKAAHTGKTLLIDLSGVQDAFARQWYLHWFFNLLCEYIETRGRKRTQQPLGVVVDELSFFTRGASLFTDAIVEKWRELIEVRARNHRVFLQLATQDLRHLDPSLQDAVLNLKSFMFGAVLNPDTAIELGKRFIECELDDLDTAVRYWNPVWVSEVYPGHPGGAPGYANHFIIDYTPVFYTLEELFYKNSRLFTNLKKGEWLLAKSTGEGQHAMTVQKIVTPKLFKPPFPADNEDNIQTMKAYLMYRDGQRLADVLAEIEAQRLYEVPAPVQTKRRRHRVGASDGQSQSMASLSGDGKPPRALPPQTAPEQTAKEQAVGNANQGRVDSPMKRRKRTG